jgi:hypothetical protein
MAESILRELNKLIKKETISTSYHMGYSTTMYRIDFFTKLDISMQSYTLELDNESKDLCTIATPLGKFKYIIDYLWVLYAPLITLRKSWKTTSAMLKMQKSILTTLVLSPSHGMIISHYCTTILTKLQDHGFMVNPLKCEWAVKETDWLVYWLTPI